MVFLYQLLILCIKVPYFYAYVQNKCKMSSVLIIVFVLCLGWCYGQEEEEVCISNFAEFENALLSNPINQYQIAKAYFPARREINPVCVTSYYYIGINGSDAVKQNCPTNIISDEDGMLSGCSKWKWCINSFYIGLDLAQLQDFSLFMLLNIDSEVELELPSVCNIKDNSVLYEYLQRITLSVSYIDISYYIIFMINFVVTVALQLCQR